MHRTIRFIGIVEKMTYTLCYLKCFWETDLKITREETGERDLLTLRILCEVKHPSMSLTHGWRDKRK